VVRRRAPLSIPEERMRRLRPRLLASLLTLAVAFAPAACGGDSRGPEREAPSDPIVVTDDAGQEVRLAQPARRVVSLQPYVTDYLTAVGAADRLVARTDYDSAAALRHLPSVGGGLTPSVEHVVSLRPDLVIAWPDGNSRTVVNQLRGFGIPVYNALDGTMDDIPATLDRLGRMLGREAAADSLQADMDRRLQGVRDTVAGRPQPTVLYLIAREPLIVAGRRTFIHDVIEAAGGRNAYGDAEAPGPQVSLEDVLVRDPDVLVIPSNDPSMRNLDWLHATPGWRGMRAVREGRVYRVQGDLFSRPGPQIPTAARVLAGLLHPEAFSPGAPASGAPAPRP
jgi:iron complex transport system substrate-binding protein